MENFSQFVKEDDQMELPPGFRFHPTDEELITHYLSKKALDGHFSARAIGEVDMNKVEPWEMPWRAKMVEQEWYFFCVRDKKYPTGQRTNRATAAGYWKATGKDKEIFRGKSLVGMRKTLVFYKGRAPKGENTNWVIHEYRLEGNFSHHKLPRKEKFSCQQNEWVICRVFQKSVGGKKVHISGPVRMNSLENQLAPSVLPPLIDAPTYGGATKPTVYEPGPVPCFSNNIDNHKTQQEMMNYFNNTLYPASSKPPGIFPRISLPNLNSWSFTNLVQGNIQNPDAFCLQDQTVFRGPLGNRPNMKDISKTEQTMISVSQETNLSNEMNTEMSSVVSNRDMSRRPFVDQEAPSTSAGPLDMDCFGIIEIDD